MAYLHICDVCKCKLPDNKKTIRVIIESERSKKYIDYYTPDKYSLNIEVCEDCAIEMHDMILSLTTKAEEIVNKLIDGER